MRHFNFPLSFPTSLSFIPTLMELNFLIKYWYLIFISINLLPLCFIYPEFYFSDVKLHNYRAADRQKVHFCKQLTILNSTSLLEDVGVTLGECQHSGQGKSKFHSFI